MNHQLFRHQGQADVTLMQSEFHILSLLFIFYNVLINY
jgi:hypothetical protein